MHRRRIKGDGDNEPGRVRRNHADERRYYVARVAAPGRIRFLRRPGLSGDEISGDLRPAAGALWYCFIGAMIGGTATSMLREVQGRRRVEGRTAADLMWSRPLALHPSESVARAQSVLAASPHTTLPVVDDEGRVVGLVSNDRAGAALAQGYANVPVAQLMEPVAVAVHPWTQGNDVLTALRQAGGREVVVVDAWGRLVGIVTAAAVKPPGRTRPPVGFGRSATGP